MKLEGWKKIVLFALIGVLLAGVFFAVYWVRVRQDMSDFGVCYRAGQRILWGETLYRTTDGHLQYKYAPVSALFYAAFAWLPYEVGKFLWYCLELFCLFAGFWISHQCLPSPEKGKWFVIGWGLLISAKFIGREIELGQVNTVIIFILVSMLAAVLRKAEILSGVLWGVSVFFKPYALVFLPYFLLKKRFKIIFSGLAVLVLGLFIPILIFGWHGNVLVLKEWVKTLSISTPVLLAVSDNASLFAFLLKIIGPGHQVWVDVLYGAVFASLAAAFLWMMWLGKKNGLEKPETLEAAYLFTLIPLFSPLGWYYNYLYAFPAVVLLLNSVGRFSPVHKYILAGNFIIIAASLREVLGKTLFRFYNRKSLMVVNYLIVLFYLGYARWKRRA